MMNEPKSKQVLDKELTEALRQTFPASDPVAVDSVDDVAVRPVNRRPPLIDKALVDELARKASHRRRAKK